MRFRPRKTTPGLPREGMWRRGFRDAWRVMGASVVVGLVLGVATGAAQEVFVSEGDGLGAAVVVAGVFAGVLLLVAIFQVARAPFRQRDEARAALVTHMEEDHPALYVDVTISDVEPFRKFRVQGANWVSATYSLCLVTIELFSHMKGDCNIEMWLVGSFGEEPYKIGDEHRFNLASLHGGRLPNWMPNPKEVPAGERKRGKVPFLTPYKAELEGLCLDGQRLLLVEGRSKEETEVAIPGFFSWRA